MFSQKLLDISKAEAVAQSLAQKAVKALLDEARLTPKPGLVDRRGSGAHSDMDLAMFEKSAETLQPFFCEMALAGWMRVPDAALRCQVGAIGRDAEKAMMKATDGVNTHRGSIWALGLLVTAYSMVGGSGDVGYILQSVSRLAGINDSACPPFFSKGRYVCQRYKVNGAREEAANGFPHITKLALPMLVYSRNIGASEDEARVNALLAIMTALPDTCVLSRGGVDALNDMHIGARSVLECGGIGSVRGKKAFYELERKMSASNVSPGGAADLLASTLFIDSLSVY